MKSHSAKYTYLFIFVFLFLLVFLSHGKTMQMYYWVDDWAMTYKVLWPEEAPGNMGPGIFGTGPYRYLVTPFIYLYPLFGFNAFPYFAIGWFLYFLTAVSVYLLAKELTQKQSIALAAASIFASGYIGAHALYRLTNSYQTVGATFLICLTVWVFTRFLRTQKSILFWISLILYVISMEIVWIRTHGLFLSLLAVAILYKFTGVAKVSVKKIILWLFPFLAIFYFMYFVDPRIKIGSNLVLSGVGAILKEGHIELFNNLMITLANALVPEQITQWIYSVLVNLLPKYSIFILTIAFAIFPMIAILKNFKQKISLVSKFINIHSIFILFLAILSLFILWSSNQKSSLWNPRELELFTAMLGGSLVLNFLYISFLHIKNNKYSSILILLALFWIQANSITLFIYSPETNLESTSRYLVPAFAGIGILYAVTFFLLLSKMKATIAVSVLCLILVFYSNKEANLLLTNVSLPDKQGYGLLLKEVNKVDEHTVFYIETEDDPRFKGTYLGRLPQLGISSLFNYHGITTLADSYDHLFSLLADRGTNINQIYTYIYGTQGYKSTTLRMQELLKNGGEQRVLNQWNSNLPSEIINQSFTTKTIVAKDEKQPIADSLIQTVGVNPTLETVLNYDSLVPAVLEFTMTISPLALWNLGFPYSDVTSQYSAQVGINNISKIQPTSMKIANAQLLSALEEEALVQSFSKQATVKATSSWKTTEEVYLTDGRLDTNWGADNNQWSSIPKPQDIVIDLGQTSNITKLIRVNHHHMATPTVYSILVSNDGVSWSKVLEVESGGRKEGGEIIQDKFPTRINTRFIKINILETFGGPGYPPAIKELWISNLEEDTDPELSKSIVECPFCYISDQNIANNVLNLSTSIATAKVWWETDRSVGYTPSYSQNFPIILDGQQHTYRIYLPAQGTKFKRLKLDGFQLPVEIMLHKVSIKSLSLEELKAEKLIKQF